MAALLLVAAGCGDDDDSGDDASSETTVAVPDGIVVGAGITDPEDANIAVLEFLPEQITIEAGTDVSWEWIGAEPHSVTFVPEGQEAPNVEADPSAVAGTPPTGPIDGTAYVSSPLQPLGPTTAAPFEGTFATPGTYEYICIIHPQMIGEITVVEAGADADSPAEVAERRADETAEWLEEGRAAKADLVEAEPVKTEKDDGTTEWTVQMGVGTEHVAVQAFAPTPAGVEAGDTVTFVNESPAPHTASFFGAGAPEGLTPFDEATVNPSPGRSPQALSSTGFYNTGLLPPNVGEGGEEPPSVQDRTYSFTVPDPGTYAYVCVFHAANEMTGEIVAT